MSTPPYNGEATGNMNDGYAINEVIVKAPKKNTTLKDLLNTAGVVAGGILLGSLNEKFVDKANTNAKKLTDGVSVKTGLDSGTMIFLAVLAVAGLGAWYYQKR